MKKLKYFILPLIISGCTDSDSIVLTGKHTEHLLSVSDFCKDISLEKTNYEEYATYSCTTSKKKYKGIILTEYSVFFPSFEFNLENGKSTLTISDYDINDSPRNIVNNVSYAIRKMSNLAKKDIEKKQLAKIKKNNFKKELKKEFGL